MDFSWIEEVLTDTVKILPFLFLTYLLMEYLERHALGRTASILNRVGPFGPAIGAGLGLIPQCGFSAAASGLFAGGLITTGTLIAVFMSTSDEMLPLLISHGFSGTGIISILIVKCIFAAVFGFLIDLVLRAAGRKNTPHIHDFCEKEHCHEEDGILVSALKHTFKIWIFILIISFALQFILNLIGFENVASYMQMNSVLSVFIASLIGLIPNCAASVALTECYLNGVLSAGAMMAGLMVSSGVGLLTLFRTNRHLKQNLRITVLLYALGVVCGFLIMLAGISF